MNPDSGGWWEKIGKELSATPHPYLLMGTVVTITVGILYTGVRSLSSQVMGDYQDVIIYGLLAFVFLGAMIADLIHTNRDKTEPSDETDDNRLYSKSIITLSEGLELLKEAVETKVGKDDYDRIVLLRLLPTEITTAFARDAKKELVDWYRKFSSATVTGGKEQADFWDETIVGHLESELSEYESKSVEEYNKAGWSAIEEDYFTGENPPDTTGIGVSSDVHEWMIMICTSRSGARIPDDYICALVLKKDKELQRPVTGHFYVDAPDSPHDGRADIARLVNEFYELQDQLNKVGKYWILQKFEKNLPGWEAVGKTVEHFMKTGNFLPPDEQQTAKQDGKMRVNDQQQRSN